MALKISVGSGATLATEIINGEHRQLIAPVSLNPIPAGSNFIGLVSVNGVVGVSGGSIFVNWNSGATVSVSNFPATQAVTQSGTWNVGVNGLISLASGSEIKSLATVVNFPATYPVTDNNGSLTVDGTVAATQSGTWNTNIQSGATVHVLNTINSIATVANFPATQAVTGTFWQATQPVSFGLVSLASGTFVSLNAGTNHIGSVSIFGNINTTAGMTTLFPGPNQIGSVTVSNTVAVSQSGTWNVGLSAGTNNIGDVDVLSLPATPAGGNYIGLVTAYPGAAFPVTDNSGSLTVDNGGTFAVQAAQSGTWNAGITGLISLASGTLIGLNAGNNNIGDVDIASIAAGDNNIGNVDVLTLPALPAGGNHIGSVSIFGNINTTAGMTTLFPGPNQIGSVTISNIPAVSQSGTWTVQPGNTANSTPWLVTQSGGLISLASGTFVSLNAGNNNIGDVDVASIAAGDNNIGNVDVVTLPALPTGTNFIGLATVTMSNSLSLGQVTLFPGPNQIGSVTVSNVVAVTQSGTWDEVGINDSGNSITVDGSVGITAGTNNIGDVDVLTLPALPAGGNYIGLVTAYPGAAFPVTDNGGALTVDGTVTANLAAGTNNIGDVDILSIAAGDNNIGNVDVVTLPALAAGTNTIGTATVFSVPISTYTSFATVYSASGNATLFVAPASQRWVLKDLLIGSQGQQVVSIKSGTEEMFPPIALATLGGFVMNNGDSGIRAKAVNTGFVLNLGATATLSVLANVRFE